MKNIMKKLYSLFHSKITIEEMKAGGIIIPEENWNMTYEEAINLRKGHPTFGTESHMKALYDKNEKGEYYRTLTSIKTDNRPSKCKIQKIKKINIGKEDVVYPTELLPTVSTVTPNN